MTLLNRLFDKFSFDNFWCGWSLCVAYYNAFNFHAPNAGWWLLLNLVCYFVIGYTTRWREKREAAMQK